MEYRKLAFTIKQGVETMSFGKIQEFIEILKKENVTDSEGFTTVEFVPLAKVRGYREGRHGMERWANLAAFSDATDLFRLRVIPNLKITMDNVLKCCDEMFEITSVENVKGKGLYLEILGKKVEATNG